MGTGTKGKMTPDSEFEWEEFTITSQDAGGNAYPTDSSIPDEDGGEGFQRMVARGLNVKLMDKFLVFLFQTTVGVGEGEVIGVKPS